MRQNLKTIPKFIWPYTMWRYQFKDVVITRLYNVLKRVIVCVITALTYIQYCAIIEVVVCRSVSVKCMWEIPAEI